MSHHAPNSVRPHRRGMTLLEVTLSAAALAIVATSVVQATVGLDRAHQASGQVDYASREMENSLKQFINQPPSDITQEAADQWQLPAEVVQQLPGSRLTTTVADLQDPIAKRVTMKLQLSNRGQPLVLTRWVPGEQEEQP